MNELIKVNYENSEQPTVSGRELWEALEIKSKYADWFKNMCGYGFNENEDYVAFSKNLENGGRTIDHQLTIPMAKELCMIQRSEKGKQFRQYFIEIENKWNTPEAVMARALQFANQKLDDIKKQNVQLSETVEIQKLRIAEYEPKVQYVDTILSSKDTVTATQIAADYGISGAMLNRILHEKHIQHKVGKQWILYAEHFNKGYTKSETISIPCTDGSQKTALHTKWTQKGRLLIHNILEARGIHANLDKE